MTYLKYIPRKTILALVAGVGIAGGGMADANAQAAAAAAAVKFGGADNLSPSFGRLDLLVGGSALDECEADLPGEAEQATGRDDTLLAMLDTNLKPRSGTAGAKGRSAGAAAAAAAVAPAAPEVEAFPVALPQAASGPAGKETWEIIVSDKTLNAALARWASKAGWQLLWELPVDYAVEAKTTVHGTFEEAVSTVAKSMASAEIPMKATFYEGNKVLRIMAKGAE